MEILLTAMGGTTGAMLAATVILARLMQKNRKKYFKIHRSFGYVTLGWGFIHGITAFFVNVL